MTSLADFIVSEALTAAATAHQQSARHQHQQSASRLVTERQFRGARPDLMSFDDSAPETGGGV